MDGPLTDGNEPVLQPGSTSPCLRIPGRNAPRSRNGCWTCRAKKVKCDEERPQCRRCLRLRLLCDYKPRRARRKPAARGSSTNITTALSLAHNSSGLSSFSPAPPATAASSVVFTAADHESVRYFRTSFARLHHTKNPDYSLFSVMFRIAQTDATVMHMVLALAGREMAFRGSKHGPDVQKGRASPLWHYAEALKMMAEGIARQGGGELALDAMQTALYLMLLYEQKYGDERCLGVAKHLTGASVLLKHRCDETLRLEPLSTDASRALALTQDVDEPPPSTNSTISIYSARLLLWISLLDTAAASCGVGGEVNGTLYGLMSRGDADGTTSVFQPLDNFEKLHRFSNSLYRTTWGEDYPQSELLDDVENRNVYFLLGACNQLRFMTAQLAKLYASDETQALRRASAVELCIYHVGNKYAELMEVAAELSLATDNSHRLVANLRAIVPHFYAAVLDFLRLTRRGGQDLALSNRQRHALRQIMNLAFQAHKHGGDEAVMRIAWPLYMVGLETDDLLHREWVLERMASIGRFGNNFERAHAFLDGVVDEQSRLGRRVDVRARLASGRVGLFII